ncbi:MAG: peptidylprolyl isomerase [Synechococcales bacterium]|nr:peptidylprolyl isomerase [Synechococcales bacterium]
MWSKTSMQPLQVTRRWFFSILMIGLVLLGGCTSASSPEVDASADPVDPSLPQLAGPAAVEMVVNGEAITVNVDGENAPVTAGNFVDLVNRGVYDGVAFHRVVREPEPFVVQGGDPQSKDPSVPPAQLGTGNFIDPTTGAPRYIPLEIKPEGGDRPIYHQTFSSLDIAEPPVLPHRRGAVAMARSAFPDSASSQFYFALTDLGFLDGEYAVFGYVDEADMTVIDQIQQGDRVETARVVVGLENLQQGSGS